MLEIIVYCLLGLIVLSVVLFAVTALVVMFSPFVYLQDIEEGQDD